VVQNDTAFWVGVRVNEDRESYGATSLAATDRRHKRRMLKVSLSAHTLSQGNGPRNPVNLLQSANGTQNPVNDWGQQNRLLTQFWMQRPGKSGFPPFVWVLYTASASGRDRGSDRSRNRSRGYSPARSPRGKRSCSRPWIPSSVRSRVSLPSRRS